MKVGTDGVLLGAWADVTTASQILDIGTGSGLIALMLAQRTADDVSIDAVEINEDACNQAKENATNSPWPEKIQFYNSPIQKFEPSIKYDLIVCNPPYFANSLKSDDFGRNQSRHNQSLSFTDLLRAVKRLIAPTGKFCVIVPYAEGMDLIIEAGKMSLFCAKKLAVKSRPGKPTERLLLQFSPNSNTINDGLLLIHNQDGKCNSEYLDLVSPYYLNL